MGSDNARHACRSSGVNHREQRRLKEHWAWQTYGSGRFRPRSGDQQRHHDGRIKRPHSYHVPTRSDLLKLLTGEALEQCAWSACLCNKATSGADICSDS